MGESLRHDATSQTRRLDSSREVRRAWLQRRHSHPSDNLETWRGDHLSDWQPTSIHERPCSPALVIPSPRDLRAGSSPEALRVKPLDRLTHFEMIWRVTLSCDGFLDTSSRCYGRSDSASAPGRVKVTTPRRLELVFDGSTVASKGLHSGD